MTDNNTPAPAHGIRLTDEEITNVLRRLAIRPGDHDFKLGQCIALAIESALLSKLRAPVADDQTLADRLDRMAFAQPTGSQAQSDLLAAATIWHKHVNHSASAPVAGEAQKPVAWETDKISPTKDRDLADHWRKMGWPVRPLYAEPPASTVAGEAVAWMHAEDPARVVSALQKATSERDGGAYASSLRPYTIALGRLAAPQASEAVQAQPRDDGSDSWDGARRSVPKAGEAVRDATDMDALRGRVIGAIHDCAALTPEDDESWDEWYCAAFDLLGTRVGDIFRAALSSKPGAQKEQSDAE